MDKSRVALVQGNDRYENIMQSLQAIKSDIDLTGKERITIKPNFVTTHRPLAATHVEAVRAVVEFLRAKGAGTITLIGGPAIGSFREGLQNYGYMPLINEHDLGVVDMNEDEGVEVEIYDRRYKPITISLSRTAVESDYRISVCPIKTHDIAIVTLSLKNLAVGSITSHKSRSHQGHKGINLNLYRLAHHVAPHLSVLDGFEAMEGSGPTRGDAVDWRIALASTDFVAADSLAAQLMGFDLADIGYLSYCARMALGRGRLDEMELVGNASPEAVRRQFKPHPSYREQLQWRVREVERYL
jgi:uncharacterized protein (DUF362 family)